MHKSVIALSAAALLAAVSVASAATMTGTIKSIDVTAKTVTLDNGRHPHARRAGRCVGSEARRKGEDHLQRIGLEHEGDGDCRSVFLILPVAIRRRAGAVPGTVLFV